MPRRSGCVWHECSCIYRLYKHKHASTALVCLCVGCLYLVMAVAWHRHRCSIGLFSRPGNVTAYCLEKSYEEALNDPYCHCGFGRRVVSHTYTVKKKNYSLWVGNMQKKLWNDDFYVSFPTEWQLNAVLRMQKRLRGSDDAEPERLSERNTVSPDQLDHLDHLKTALDLLRSVCKSNSQWCFTYIFLLFLSLFLIFYTTWSHSYHIITT